MRNAECLEARLADVTLATATNASTFEERRSALVADAEAAGYQAIANELRSN